MFIHLDDSLLVDKSDPIYYNVVRAIRNLAIAAYESKHILYGDYDIIVAMREHFRHDHDVWDVFNRIYQKYSRMACPTEISYYLKVAKEAGENSVDEGGKQFGQVPYDVFEDTESTQVCNLISEDFNDCEFYKHVLDYYKKQNGIKISCKFHDVSGSGDRTIDNVRNCVCGNKQVSVCIVDTDKKYPEQALSTRSTCYKCQRIGVGVPTYLFVALEVQEIENLVPFNVLDCLAWNDASRVNRNSFGHLQNNAKSEYILPYFDIKNGILKDDLLKTDMNYRHFAMICYYLHPELASNGNFDVYVNGLEDKAVVYPHLLKGLLKSYLEYVKETPRFDIELLEFQQLEWDKIGKAMLNMGCSRNTEALAG